MAPLAGTATTVDATAGSDSGSSGALVAATEAHGSFSTAPGLTISGEAVRSSLQNAWPIDAMSLKEDLVLGFIQAMLAHDQSYTHVRKQLLLDVVLHSVAMLFQICNRLR